MLRQIRTSIQTLLLLIVVAQTTWPLAAASVARTDENPGESQPADDLQRLPTDRATLRELDRLRESIDDRDINTFNSSLRALRAAEPILMTQGPDSFQPLHRTLMLLLQQLPPELATARDADDISASAELLRTLQNPEPAELLNLLQRCNGTPTARKILLILARLHEDRGQQAAARYWLLPLLNAPPDSLPPHVLALQRRLEAGNSPPTPAPQPTTSPPVPPSSASTIGSRLPADPASALPRNIQWTRSLPLLDTARRTLHEYVTTATASATVPWSAFTPLADQNSIFVRSQSIIAALDRSTGRTLWTRNLRPGARAVDQSSSSSRMIQPFPNIAGSPRSNPARDAHSWQLAMDAERLYVISADPDPSNQFRDEESLRIRMFIGRDDSARRPPQEFSAIDKQTGRRLWTVGGEPVEATFGNPLSRCWFAGLPAMHGPNLCLLVEKDGQISLACLAAKDGSLLWQIPLVFPENNIDQDMLRQLLAAQLSVHQGILLASTTTGWSFAVDLLTHAPLWARPITPQSSGQASTARNRRAAFQQRFIRGRMLNSSAEPGHRRSEQPLVIGNEVLWTLNEVPQITVTTLLTGEISRRLDTSEPALVLWADTELLVAASASEITAWQTADFSLRWKSQLNSQVAVPVGTAVRRGNQLLIPAADGSLQIRSLANGQLVDSLPNLRPVQQPGTLTAFDSDLISAGPGYLTLAAARQPTPQPGEDSLEQAAFLLATNQPAEALQVLSNAPATSLNEERLRQLRFRSALCLFARNPTNPTADLQQLLTLAGSAPEKAVATWLQLADPGLPQGSERVQLLFNALQLPPTVLRIQLPDTPTLLNTARIGGIDNILDVPAVATGLETLRWPLKALILQELATLLNGPDSESRSTLLKQLPELNDHALCSLTAPSLTTECLTRAERQLNAGPPAEITLHLLFAAAENIKRETNSDLQNAAILKLTQLFTLASRQAADNPAISPFEQTLLNHLIRTLAQEVCHSPSFTPPATENSLASTPSASSTWQAIAEVAWNVTPVSTISQSDSRSPSIRGLRPAFATDPVLNVCNWSSQPGSGEFVARAFTSDLPGTWRLRFQSPDQQLLSPDESLLRCGSIVIHRSNNTFTAFSLLDRRWLWSRSDLNVSSFGFSSDTFTEFDIDREGRFVFEQGRRLAGHTNRWLCLMTDSSLEVFDLLTGEQRWQMKAQGLTRHSFACDDAVFARSVETVSAATQRPPRISELILNPATGRPRPKKSAPLSVDDQQEFRLPASARLAALSRHLIRASANYLVAWDPQSQLDDVKTIEWIDALSLETVHQVQLTDFAAAQFLDPRLLAVFTTTGNVLLVDLQTAHTQTFAGAGNIPNLPSLPADRIGAAIDAGNLYLFRNADSANTEVRPPGFYSIPTKHADQQLRAIDRQTGQLRWAIPINSFHLVFDHSQMPVLIALHTRTLVREQNNANAVQGFSGISQTIVTGFAKSSGREVFTLPIVSQFPVQGLKLTIPAGNRMELEAFGTRIHLTPADAPAP
ncbi:MAG: PQQ-binding-like beta-propeller repeat protein [Planctomycetota bacterium]